MIRGLDSFRDRLTDKSYSNVIFVFSHFTSETQKVRRNPKDKLKKLKKVIEEYSRFPRPVVLAVAENKAEENGLMMLNGYYKLPNGDYYPKNLFDRITQVTRGSGDAIGDAVIRSAFKNPDCFNISSSDFSLAGNQSSKVSKYLGILSAAVFSVNKTEVSNKLAVAYESMPVALKQRFPDALYYLQKSLNLGNYIKVTDLPRTTTAIVKLISELRQNDAVLFLLQKAFDITPPVFPEKVLTGYSYNVFQDQALPLSPFDLGQLQDSEIGYKLPAMITCNVEFHKKDILHFLQNRNEYMVERFKSMQVAGSVPVERFTGAIKPGYNVFDQITTMDGVLFSPITAVREIRTFELILNDRFKLNNEFKNTVNSLPPYNASDYQSVDLWNTFFSQYGTHVVKAAYGGGAIEITVKANSTMSPEIQGVLVSFIQFTEDVTLGKPGTSSLNPEGAEFSLEFAGGDTKLHATGLTDMNLQDAADILSKWKESLLVSPVILTNEMKLLPISQVTKRLGQNISSEIEKATKLFFNASLTYIPPRPASENLPGGDRHSTQLTKAMELVANMQEKMAEESRKSAERFKNMTEQYKKESENREKLHKEAIAAMKRSISSSSQTTINRMQSRIDTQKSNYEQKLELERKRKKKSCLRKGTLILMNDFSQKPVELLEVGETILDHNLVPVRVGGVLEKFLLSDSFHGFDNETFFFTDTHQLVGETPGNDFQIYVKDLDKTLLENPLLAFMHVQKLPDKSEILRYNPESKSVLPEAVNVFSDPTNYPPTTPVFIILVDSESGTYSANGYVCRHEIPPLKHWPNTLSVLFSLVSQPKIKRIENVPYNMKTLTNIERIVEGGYVRLQEILKEEGAGVNEGRSMIDSQGLKFSDQIIFEIFRNPTFSAFALGIYEKLGLALAEKLDVDAPFDSDRETKTRRLQFFVFEGLKEFFATAISDAF